MDWGDVGTLAPGTYAQDKTGATITPGWKQVLDRATGKLVPCDATTCPNAVDGVNYAPFASFGGWSGAVNAKATVEAQQDAAYDFLSYMSAPAQSSVDVTLGKTGYNPYRTSQFTNQAPWLAAGLSEAATDNYLGAIKDQPREPELRARPADPADQAVRAGRARHGDRPVPCQGAGRGRHRAGHRRWLERHHRPGRARTSSSLPTSRVLASSGSAVDLEPGGAGPDSGPAPRRARPRAGRPTTLGAWRSDGAASWLFIWPAVLLILVLSIFPLVASVALSVSKLVFRAGRRRPRLHRASRTTSSSCSASSESHFLGVLKTPNPLGWAILDRRPSC